MIWSHSARPHTLKQRPLQRQLKTIGREGERGLERVRSAVLLAEAKRKEDSPFFGQVQTCPNNIARVPIGGGRA
jgi:hypothetical protein